VSGYREISSYNPREPRPGAPARPYDRVQWIGVGVGSLGLFVLLADIAGRFGWIPKPFDDPSALITAFTVLGTVLVSSRRGPAPDLSDPEVAARRRWALAGALVLAALIGAAIAILQARGA
jgi:hypothetical protein